MKSDEELASLKGKNTTCVGSFASEASPGYAVLKRVANILRGELVFAARFGEDKPLELWPFEQESAYKFDGALEDDGTALVRWIRPRIIPVLQEYVWHLRETYEALDLPMAKVWFNDTDKNPSFDDVWSDAVRQVAKRFMGKIAFVMQKRTAHEYELRDYGMTSPESFPVFGISTNASHNSIKYGFEVTPDVASSAPEFWKDTDKVIERLSLFCEDVLAGKWPEAHESTSRQTNWTEGHVKRIVWNTFAEIESPEKPLLLSLFSRYRPNNDKMQKEIENLATALKPHSGLFTVASYVTSDNHLPSGEFNNRDRYSPDTEWWWIPAVSAGAKRKLAPKKLMKPKKDAPIKTVISFALKNAGIPSIDADDIMVRFEALMEENVSTNVDALESPGANLLEGAGVFEQKDELGGPQEL
jgi:hypothetical protein